MPGGGRRRGAGCGQAALRRCCCVAATLALAHRCWSVLQSTASALSHWWADLGLRGGAAPPLKVSALFANCGGELVRVRYRWDSRW